MDLLIEILLDVYMELMLLVIPEEKVSRRHKIIAKVIAISILCGVLALIVWGVVLIVDHGNLLGVVPITVAAVISVVQIALGIVFFTRNNRAD